MLAVGAEDARAGDGVVTVSSARDAEGRFGVTVSGTREAAGDAWGPRDGVPDAGCAPALSDGLRFEADEALCVAGLGTTPMVPSRALTEARSCGLEAAKRCAHNTQLRTNKHAHGHRVYNIIYKYKYI